MKPKYSIGETVRIKATGEKVKIDDTSIWDNEYIYWIKSSDNIHRWHGEDELKPYRPSRTGKYRNEKGQFMSKEIQEFEGFTKLKKTNTWITTSDSKQRNYQKILTKLDELEKKIDELEKQQEESICWICKNI